MTSTDKSQLKRDNERMLQRIIDIKQRGKSPLLLRSWTNMGSRGFQSPSYIRERQAQLKYTRYNMEDSVVELRTVSRSNKKKRKAPECLKNIEETRYRQRKDRQMMIAIENIKLFNKILNQKPVLSSQKLGIPANRPKRTRYFHFSFESQNDLLARQSSELSRNRYCSLLPGENRARDASHLSSANSSKLTYQSVLQQLEKCHKTELPIEDFNQSVSFCDHSMDRWADEVTEDKYLALMCKRPKAKGKPIHPSASRFPQQSKLYGSNASALTIVRQGETRAVGDLETTAKKSRGFFVQLPRLPGKRDYMEDSYDHTNLNNNPSREIDYLSKSDWLPESSSGSRNNF